MLHLPTATPGGTARLRAGPRSAHGNSPLPAVNPPVSPLEYPQEQCVPLSPVWYLKLKRTRCRLGVYEVSIQALQTAAGLGLQRSLGSCLHSELSEMKRFVQKAGTWAQCKISATAHNYFGQLHSCKKQLCTLIKIELFWFLVVGDNCVNIVPILKIKYIISRILFLH